MYGGLCAGAKNANSSIAASTSASTRRAPPTGPACTALKPIAASSARWRSGFAFAGDLGHAVPDGRFIVGAGATGLSDAFNPPLGEDGVALDGVEPVLE